MTDLSHNLTWVEVDLAAIRHNARWLAAQAGGAGLMAVVKADAYGHGAVPVGRAALAAGAQWLAVARPAEGLALRAGGITAPVLVLGYTPPGQAEAAIAAGLTLAVFEAETAAAYAALARAQGRVAQVHVKLDSGMGRLGVLPADAVAFVRGLRALAGLDVDGLFTHFAGSDLDDQTSTLAQVAALDGVLAALDAAGLRPPHVHAANSAALLRQADATRYDLVRSGILLYGLDPSDEVPAPGNLRPALAWKTRVAQVKTLPPGHGVSYGPEYTTTSEERLAVLAVGYGDGFRRVPKGVNAVLIGGQAAPIRGRVCMDQCVAGIAHVAGVRAGDEAVLIGTQGAASIPAGALAARWGTNVYDVVTGILARVERVYLNG